MTTNTSSQTLQYLTWIIGPYRFAMDLRRCREVSRNMHISTVPRAPEFVSGIVNLRGDVVTVLNLHSLLGFESNKERDQSVIIRLKSNQGHIALLADEISDIIDVSDEQLDIIPPNLGEIETLYLMASVKINENLILVINADSLLNAGSK